MTNSFPTFSSATASISGFFNSNAWLLVRNLSFFFVAVFWIAVAYWVNKDARRRIEDPWLIGTSTALALLFPFFGAIIYMLFRPPEYLDEVHERELEIKEMEARLGSTLPRLPGRDRPGLPRLPCLHHSPQTTLRPLQGAAGAALADLSLLRRLCCAPGGRPGRHLGEAAAPAQITLTGASESPAGVFWFFAGPPARVRSIPADED